MAKHKIFIGEYGVGRMRLGDSRSTDYSYDSDANVLTIYWCGKEVARCENAKAGDAFLVICEGGEPQLQELHFPKHPNESKKADLSNLPHTGTGIRTPTYRVRVCCATFTQYRYWIEENGPFACRPGDIITDSRSDVKGFSKKPETFSPIRGDGEKRQKRTGTEAFPRFTQSLCRFTA